jgi:hypothetical protein
MRIATTMIDIFTLPSWLFFPGTVVVALFFYWLRCKYKVVYGVAEILVSLCLMYLAYSPSTGTATGDAVALARKLAVVLHRMLVDGTSFLADKAVVTTAR